MIQKIAQYVLDAHQILVKFLNDCFILLGQPSKDFKAKQNTASRGQESKDLYKQTEKAKK